eukprot:scaffold939_cov181-Pinguiococcus_pyrenoidosus.AAC.2
MKCVEAGRTRIFTPLRSLTPTLDVCTPSTSFGSAPLKKWKKSYKRTFHVKNGEALCDRTRVMPGCDSRATVPTTASTASAST